MERQEAPAHGPLIAACALVVAIGCANVEAQAQEAPPAEQPTAAAEQPTTGEVPAETDLLAPEQLDILVAPVALYPDPLLVLVLQGSTFPIEVVAANRFLGKLAEQPELQPDPEWDTSIVGLLNYPEVLARMDDELDWTEALGEAVLNQLGDVQASIQQVRLQAYMAGMLATDEQQVVTGSPDLIIVLPADETQMFGIGENELAAIEALRAYVQAQIEYASADRDGDQVLEYAQRVISTPGQRDGLYWASAPGEPVSPFGPFIAEISALIQGKELGDPYRGYYYRVLKGQTEHAPGGAYEYVINGNMIAGFAMLAWPAEYGETGVMTFQVSHQGDVLEADLAEVAPAFDAYDPDATWTEVTD
jgi:hypothetical protein